MSNTTGDMTDARAHSDTEFGGDHGVDFFADPEDYYPPSPPPTQQTYTMQSGAQQSIRLRLVGHSPLEAHHLWNGARVVSEYLEEHAQDQEGVSVHGKTVLELGAGAGLPSLVAALLGARKVVMTDFPDPELLANMRRNVLDCAAVAWPLEDRVVVEGYVWGGNPERLLQHLPAEARRDKDGGFDVLVLADLIFRHSEHGRLLDTIAETLRRDVRAAALVFFTSYRPWLRHKDLAFFDGARERGFMVDKIMDKKTERPLFEEDPGDEEVRRTVTGWTVRWPEEACQAA